MIRSTSSAGSVSGSTPFWKQLARKMSPKLGAMTHRNPNATVAHTACSRELPHPKFSPVTSTSAPA